MSRARLWAYNSRQLLVLRHRVFREMQLAFEFPDAETRKREPERAQTFRILSKVIDRGGLAS